MIIREYDKDKHAAAVDHLAALDGERRELATAMTENYMKNKDEKWTDAQFMAHQVKIQRHTQLVAEVDMAEKVVGQYDKLKPQPKQTESERLADPMVRWGQVAFGQEERLENVFSIEERKAYTVTPSFAANALNVDPNQLGVGFVVRIPEAPLASYDLDPQMRTRSDDSSGQVISPRVTQPRIIQRLKAFGGAVRFGEMFTTPRGNDYVVPNLDDAMHEGEQRANQDAAVADQDLEDIGSSTFKAYTYTSKGITLSYEAEQDSIPTLMNVVQDIAGRRIGRIRNQRLTTGTGVSQPRGLITCAEEAFTTKNSNAITIDATDDEIVDLIYSVDAAYLEGEGDPLGFSEEGGNGMTGFMVHRDVEKLMIKPKDTQGRPLWLPSIREGLAGLIYGKPYVINFAMDPLATDGGHSIIYGNGNYYGIRQVQDVQFFRFFDSATVLGAAGKLSVKFVAIARGDGQPRGGFAGTAGVTEAFKSIKTKA